MLKSISAAFSKDSSNHRASRVLFTGTTRINLDPFDEFSDAEVWAALDAAALGPTVRELEGPHKENDPASPSH